MEDSLMLPRITASRTGYSWTMLPARLVLFSAFQALIALGYRIAGESDAWNSSAAW